MKAALCLARVVGALTLGRAPTFENAHALLRRNEVSAVLVDFDTPEAAREPWATAAEGYALCEVDVAAPDDEAVETVTAAMSETFWGCGCCDDAPQRVAPDLVALARGFDAALGDRTDNGRVRVKVTVARDSDPWLCPFLHTDDVVLRGLVALAGAGTIVAPTARLRPANVPEWAWRLQEPPSDADPPTTSAATGELLLLKGRRWGAFAAAAAHRSPEPADGLRVLVALDRLCDA